MQDARGFLRNERGQSLSEYCLIAALIALVALGIVIEAAGGISGLWKAADTIMAGNPAPAAPANPTPTQSPGHR
jgi:Flp pilus assembly pilin Flp